MDEIKIWQLGPIVLHSYHSSWQWDTNCVSAGELVIDGNNRWMEAGISLAFVWGVAPAVQSWVPVCS